MSQSLLVIVVLVSAGCSPAQIKRDFIIDQVIQGAQKYAATAMREHSDIFRDVKVSKEGSDTVHLEFTLQPQAETSASDLRNEYLAALKENEAGRREMKQVLDAGIHFHVIYRNSSREVLDDFRLTSGDL